MRTALILNPTAGASMLARQHIPEQELETALRQELQALGIEPEIHYTTPEDPGYRIARQLVAAHTELIIAIGGDGTVHAVAQALIGSECVLGIIPAGTMNNLAYSLGIPAVLEEACELFVSGEVRNIDVGMVNQHPFMEVAGIGLGAALFPAAEEMKSRGLFSMLKGIIDGLRALSTFRAPQMKVIFDGQRPRTYRALEITICNAPYYGAHLNLEDGIVMDDGLLDVVIYTNFSKREYLLHALSISQGRRPFTPKIVYRRAKSLSVSTNATVDVQADGVVCGSTPANVTLLPGALKVQVPKKPVPGLLPEHREQAPRVMKRSKKLYV